MNYQRTDYQYFLQTEYEVKKKKFARLIATKALTLKEDGKVFVGKFVGYKDDFALFMVRMTEKMPRRNSFWTASYLVEDKYSYKNWGNLSWEELREGFQGDYSDAYCAWIGKSDDPNFCLVGIKGLTVQFASILEPQKPIIAFGPKDPPLRYLLNLNDIVSDIDDERLRDVLDFDISEPNMWNPVRISSKEDLAKQIFESWEKSDIVAIQGPPGTGKTFKMANLISILLKEKKSVLVTSLTNEALKVLAAKDDLKPFLESGKISKTSLTVDEKRYLPKLIANKDNSCNPASGYLSLATFYVSSGWAKDMTDDVPFDYVIMDEASQSLLPMLAASMKLGRKVLWVGDQKQLSPVVETDEDIIHSKGWTPFVKGFDTVCNNMKLPGFMLNETYRLTERGAKFTGIFYNNRLSAVNATTKINTPTKILNSAGGPSLLDLDLKIGDKKPENAFKEIFSLAESIRKENPEAEIAILSKFISTVEALQKYFLSKLDMVEIPKKYKIETVDSIQGTTVDYTIFLIPNASVSYSLENEFFNVATSRAKFCTVVVADKKILKNFMSPEVRRFFLKMNDEKMATFEAPLQQIKSGNINVTVLGKIDLPKRHFKEIVEGKENIFIIDTNVFVKCPTIISRVGNYKVVIPTTVLEELDGLKLKPNIDKQALSTAVKNINKAFLNNYTKMVDGDSDLLPKGFSAKKADCLILSVALKYMQENVHPILLTSDNLLQSKALGLGITTISLSDFLSERRH